MTQDLNKLAERPAIKLRCRICGDRIDGLGTELGKKVCFYCERPLLIGQGEEE